MAQAARLNLRLQKELKLLLADPPPSASFPSLSSSSSSLTSIDALLQGPEASVYANGVFKIKIQIPERYPFQPPIVTFATPIYHPNIDTGGRICLDILNLPPKGTWQPSLNIWTVLTSIGLLLNEPNPDDGLMHDASRDYKYNRQAFDQHARFMTEKYARAVESDNHSHSCPGTDNNEFQGTHSSVSVTEQFASHEESSGSSSKQCSSIHEPPINDCLMTTRKKLSLNTSAVPRSLISKHPSSDLLNRGSPGMEIPTVKEDSRTSLPSMVPVGSKNAEKVSRTFTGRSAGLRLKKAGSGLKSSAQHLEKGKENLQPVQYPTHRDESTGYKRVGKQIVVDLQKPADPHPKLLQAKNDTRLKDYGQNPDPDFVEEFSNKLEQCTEDRFNLESTIVLDSEDSEDERVPVRSRTSAIAKLCLTRKRKSNF